MRIVEICYRGEARCAVVENSSQLRLLTVKGGTYQVAQAAFRQGLTVQQLIATHRSQIVVDYKQAIDVGNMRVPCMHTDPAHCYVTGTGLTHTGSAQTRDAMHTQLSQPAEQLSDSMKMFQAGIEGGKPKAGEIGAEPEWFYKGDGSIVAAPWQALAVPEFAEDAGEEPEIAVFYLIDEQGEPQRIGYAIGNEFSDHVKERKNYLLLAHSKLRMCSVGPEIYLGELPAQLTGNSRILRGGQVLWEKPFLTGEDNMVHTIKNLEYHHFKYSQFRRPGDLHIHFLGTATLSYADHVVVENADEIEISLALFGRPLINRVTFASER
ncbi:MAG: AraD1 family protein [Ostreibacterium sp.]